MKVFIDKRKEREKFKTDGLGKTTSQSSEVLEFERHDLAVVAGDGQMNVFVVGAAQTQQKVVERKEEQTKSASCGSDVFWFPHAWE